MYTSILTLNCHVKPEASALVTIVLDGISQQFNLLPTINWVPSTILQGSREIFINLPVLLDTEEYLQQNIPVSFHSSSEQDRQIFLSTENRDGLAEEKSDLHIRCVNYEFEIKAEHTDILICGYNCSHGSFNISTQPVWNTPDWQPYDISGHIGDSPLYSGPGSLQILNGQTVRFQGTLTIQLKPLAP